MKSYILLSIFSALQLAASQKLSYVAEPPDVYVAPKPANITTLLDFIESRDDLSNLSSILREPAGFVKAFDAAPTWSFTFFAPSNEAFENTGAYYSSFAATR
jgi:Fasciclin domain.